MTIFSFINKKDDCMKDEMTLEQKPNVISSFFGARRYC